MGVLHFKTLTWIDNDCPKTDDDINQEEKVDTRIYKGDIRTAVETMSFIGVENLERNEYRVVKREQDDPVVPVLNKAAVG